MNLNDFDIANYLTQSLIFVPIIVGIVQAIKMTAIPEKYAPIISILVGVLIAFITSGNSHYWGHSLLGGLTWGLSASGLYSGTKTLMQQRKGEGKD